MEQDDMPPKIYYSQYAEADALSYQYEARLRSANAREVKRFGPMRCAHMQRESAVLYAAARAALGLSD